MRYEMQFVYWIDLVQNNCNVNGNKINSNGYIYAENNTIINMNTLYHHQHQQNMNVNVPINIIETLSCSIKFQIPNEDKLKYVIHYNISN